MSRHSYQPEMRRGIGRFAFSLLGGLLLASQLVFPLTSFALSTRTANSTDPPASQSLALSEVSVVRLVYSFSASSASTGTAVLCTSLGVLVKSFPASSPATLNTRVLTDGSLLNTAPAPCAPTGSSSRGKTSTVYTLSSITVYVNNVYTGDASTHALLGTYTAAPANGFVCFATPCTNGAFLFAIHTDHLQPTLDVATTNTTLLFGIALTSQASPTARPSAPLASTAAALAFLNPTAVMLGAISNQNEVGMPFINNSGQLVGLQLQNNVSLTSSDFNTFVAQRSIFATTPANPLQTAWENGIAAYYSHNYHDAIKDFQNVESLNPAFVAAKTFELKATALSNAQSNAVSGTSAPSSGNATFFSMPRSTFLIIGIVAGFLLLILLIVIVTVWIRRRHELARFEAEQAESQRNAKSEIPQQQIVQQQNTPVEMTNLEFLVQDNASKKQNVSTINPSDPTNQLCPNCGRAVPEGAIYCANCRYPLSPIGRSVPPALEFSGIEKALPTSVTTSQQQLTPVKEKVLDDLAIQEALKRLWDRAER